MPSAKITSKGQITIPRAIRDHLGAGTGDRLAFHVQKTGEVLVETESIDLRSLQSILKRPGRAPVSLDDMDAAIRRGASRRR